ncbi:MAG: isocitrate lyase/PEP mutase family protein [Desulfobacterales bacterium]|nr:isocitrate lyase/PEP mutase family protein [Desulfobacterales bacterium]
MSKGSTLRTLFSTGNIVVAPGAHDALTARVSEMTGFPAVYMTGYGQAASHLGGPDVGLLSLTEMVDRARNMAACVDIPVIADADTGFGNAINVIRTVREYESAGVAAIQLEDQVSPKKCGHMLGCDVIPKNEMVGKIQAAVDTRKDDGLMIIARTDARTVFGIDEALERGRAYEEAGADIIFIESPENIEEMKRINEVINIPTLANMVEGGRTPLLKNNELATIGFDLVIYPTASTYMTSKAMLQLMEHLMKEGSTQGLMDHMLTFSEFNELIGLPRIHKLVNQYIP